MKKITLFLILSLTIMLAGCKKETATQGESEDTEVFPVEELTLDNSSDPVAVETTFKDPFVEGNFYYTIKNTDIYTSLEQAGIDEEELIMPYNTYGSQELWGEYGEISDYIDETGIVIDNHQLVVLEINLRNEDAEGLFKKNEFNIYDLGLYGGKPITHYYPAYFSEAGKVDLAQPFHYTLEQGQEINVKVAYLVLKEDIEGLVGMINETQFAINK